MTALVFSEEYNGRTLEVKRAAGLDYFGISIFEVSSLHTCSDHTDFTTG